MHELSVAMAIVKTAEFEVRKVKGVSVTEIYLEIGKLSGVEMSSLRFVWQISVNNTVLQNAKLIVTEPEGLATCLECNKAYPIAHYYDCCPFCNSPFKSIESGKELKIRKLIIN